jgi:hypothetical protein
MEMKLILPNHFIRNHFDMNIFNTFQIPVGVLTDSYKAGHFLQYPEAKKMVAYGEFRSPFENNKEDSRLVFYGIR